MDIASDQLTNLPQGALPDGKAAASAPFPETLVIDSPNKNAVMINRRNANDLDLTEGTLPPDVQTNLQEPLDWRALISQTPHSQAGPLTTRNDAPPGTETPLAPAKPAVNPETDTPLDSSAVTADASPPQGPTAPLYVEPAIALQQDTSQESTFPYSGEGPEAAVGVDIARKEAARSILEGQKVEISPGDVLALLKSMTEELTPKPKHIYDHAMRPGGTTVLKEIVERKFNPQWDNEVIGSVTGHLATDVIPHMIPGISLEDAQSMAEFCYGNARNQAYGWNIPQRMVPSTENGWPNHKAYGQITDELTQWLQSHLSKEERALSQLQQGFHQDVQPSQPPVSREEISKKLPSEQFRKEDSIAASDTENWLGLDGFGGWVRQSIQQVYSQITGELAQWLQDHLSKSERALSQLRQGFHQDVQPSQPPVSREEISQKLPNQAAYGYTFEQFRKEDSIAAADTENWLGLDGCGGWVRQSIQLGSSGNEEGVAYMKDGRVITEMAIDMADPTSELEQAVNGGRLTWQEALNIEKGLKAIGIMFPYGDSELANRRIRDNISSSARKVAQAGSEFEIQKEMRNLAMAMKQKVDPDKKYALIALPPLTPPANTQAPASGQDQSETAGIPLPDKDNREYYRLVQDYGLREAVAQTKTRDPLVTPRLFEVAAALKDKGIPAAITYEKVQRPDQLTPRHEVVVTYQDGSRGYVDFGRSADSRPGQAVLSNPLVPTKPDREDDWPYRTNQYHNRPEIAQASEKAVWGPHEVASGYIDHELLEYDKLGLIPGLLRLLHNPPNGVTKAQLEKAVAEAKRAGAAGIKKWIYFNYNDLRKDYNLVVSDPDYEG